MAFCRFCGGQVPDGAHNCPSCGALIDGAAQNTNTQQSAPPPPDQQQSQTVGGGLNTGGFDYSDLNSSNKWCYALAYLWILFFLPLVVCPDSRVGRFHANQGLLLFIVSTGCGLIAGFLGLFGAIPVLGAILGTIGGIIGWAAGVIHLAGFIYALVNILNNLAVELPVIGKYRLIK